MMGKMMPPTLSLRVHGNLRRRRDVLPTETASHGLYPSRPGFFGCKILWYNTHTWKEEQTIPDSYYDTLCEQHLPVCRANACHHHAEDCQERASKH